MLPIYSDAIKASEGYTSKAKFDYAQHSNGYGTKAAFPDEVIDQTEADRRFQSEIQNAYRIVELHADGLDEGTKAALTSLTYNAGTTWIHDGLGDAVRRGDLNEIRSLFIQYNKAGGEVLPGLTKRRLEEVLWIGMNPEGKTATTSSLGVVSPTMSELQMNMGIVPPQFDEVGSVEPYRTSAMPEGFLFSRDLEWATQISGVAHHHGSFDDLRRKLVGLLFGLFRP